MFVQCTVHTSSSLFFLTNKPFFQKFYLLLPDMGGCEAVSRGCEKKFPRAPRAVKFLTPLFKFLYTPLFVDLICILCVLLDFNFQIT